MRFVQLREKPKLKGGLINNLLLNEYNNDNMYIIIVSPQKAMSSVSSETLNMWVVCISSIVEDRDPRYSLFHNFILPLYCDNQDQLV